MIIYLTQDIARISTATSPYALTGYTAGYGGRYYFEAHVHEGSRMGEMVEEETLKRVRKVKLLKEPPGRLRFLSKEECQALTRGLQFSPEAH
ncbi:MAG: hypothetical protein V3W51_03035 [Candidatus Brocadiales bacterium]